MRKNSLWPALEKILRPNYEFTRGPLMLHKDASGGYNLLGKFSNRWRDTDFHSNPLNGGDIVTDAAHKEFADWLDKHPQHALELWSFHSWGTARKSRANWWGYSGNSFYMNWPLTDEEAKAISTWTLDNEPGMSFGFYVFGYDQEEGLINKYRAFEASILPKQYAANPWASFQLVTNQENNMAFDPNKRKALVTLHGEAFVKELEKSDEAQAALLDTAGVESKEVTAAVETAVETPAEKAVVDTSAFATQKEVVDALQRQEGAFTEAVKTLLEKIEALETEVKSMKQAEEVAAKVAAAPMSVLAGHMPKSILEQAKITAAATEQAVQKNSAQIAGTSSLARSKPAAVGSTKRAVLTISDIPQGGN